MATRSTPPADDPSVDVDLTELHARAAEAARAACSPDAVNPPGTPTGTGLVDVTTADTSTA